MKWIFENRNLENTLIAKDKLKQHGFINFVNVFDYKTGHIITFNVNNRYVSAYYVDSMEDVEWPMTVDHIDFELCLKFIDLINSQISIRDICFDVNENIIDDFSMMLKLAYNQSLYHHTATQDKIYIKKYVDDFQMMLLQET